MTDFKTKLIRIKTPLELTKRQPDPFCREQRKKIREENARLCQQVKEQTS